jgi:hypothetical protein
LYSPTVGSCKRDFPVGSTGWLNQIRLIWTTLHPTGRLIKASIRWANFAIAQSARVQRVSCAYVAARGIEIAVKVPVRPTAASLKQCA